MASVEEKLQRIFRYKIKIKIFILSLDTLSKCSLPTIIQAIATLSVANAAKLLCN